MRAYSHGLHSNWIRAPFEDGDQSKSNPKLYTPTTALPKINPKFRIYFGLQPRLSYYTHINHAFLNAVNTDNIIDLIVKEGANLA